MRDDLMHRFAHQLVRHVQRTRCRIGRTSFHDQPVAVRPHVIVIPGDFTVDDFARTRIVCVWSRRIPREARGPAHD